MTAFLRTAGLGAILTTAATIVPLTGGANNERSPIARETTYGVVVGADDSATSGTYSWKGVPFAKAPVGALRWKAPLDPEPWAQPLTTQQFGNACVQSGRLYGPGQNNRYDATIGSTLGQTLGAEDCLYLNIWRPASASTNLPVIVFVHGGSNISGYTADPLYDGAALAKSAAAVVVTVNYRLGIFGFFSLPQLRTGANALDDSGNFAILDLVKALQFVNREIAQFGGNPGNVTVMGQSAGAINVYALQTSPLVVDADPPLLHRVVPLSGGLSPASRLPPGSIPTLAPQASYEAQAHMLLGNLIIADALAPDAAAAQTWVATQTAAQVADYLRSKPADVLLTTVLTKLAPLGASGSGPIPEGVVVPIDPIAAIESGRYAKVPVLAGNTRDEGKLFASFLALSPALGGASGRLLTDAQVFAIAAEYAPDGPATTTIEQWIPAQYLPVSTPETGFNARTDLLNRLFFIASRDSILNALKARQDTVWYYQFDWDEEPAPFNDIYGAAHAFDLAFLFGNFGPSLYANITNSTANSAGRLALSEAMMKAVGAFAAAGDPNHATLGVVWPSWPATLRFDASANAPVISVE